MVALSFYVEVVRNSMGSPDSPTNLTDFHSILNERVAAFHFSPCYCGFIFLSKIRILIEI